MDPFFKFWDKVKIGDGCWFRDGNVLSTGYGLFYVSPSKRQSAHKFAYESMVGPVAPGLTIDHICHNKAYERGECEGGRSCVHRQCVRPDHLRPETYQHNVEQGAAGKGAMNRPCKHGHLNWYWSETSRRWRCRTCIRNNLMRWKEAKRRGPSQKASRT